MLTILWVVGALILVPTLLVIAVTVADMAEARKSPQSKRSHD